MTKPRMTIVSKDLPFEPINKLMQVSRGWYVCDEDGRYYLDKTGTVANGIRDRGCFWPTEQEARQAMLASNGAPHGVAVSWQFFQGGAWHNGDDCDKDHRKNTEAADIPTRDLFAYPPMARDVLMALAAEVNDAALNYLGKPVDLTAIVDRYAALPPEQQAEPFGYFTTTPFGWENCTEDDKGAIALYEHPPAQQQAEPVVHGKTPGCKQCDEAEACGLTFCPECDAQICDGHDGAEEIAAQPPAAAQLMGLPYEKARTILLTHGMSSRQAEVAIEELNALLALAAAQPPAVAVPGGWRLVPVEFLQGFNTLAHNYSLQAQAPNYYYGHERSAFSDAYARCGRDLGKLRAMLTAAQKGGE